MSNLTRKLWKVADAVEVQATTIRSSNMFEDLMSWAKNNKKVVAIVGVVLALMVFNSLTGTYTPPA